jgi:hypothetical protein
MKKSAQRPSGQLDKSVRKRRAIVLCCCFLDVTSKQYDCYERANKISKMIPCVVLQHVMHQTPTISLHFTAPFEPNRLGPSQNSQAVSMSLLQNSTRSVLWNAKSRGHSEFYCLICSNPACYLRASFPVVYQFDHVLCSKGICSYIAKWQKRLSNSK